MSIFTRFLWVLICCLCALSPAWANATKGVPVHGKQTAKDTLVTDTVKKVKQQIYFQTPSNLSTASTAAISGSDFVSTPVVSYPLALGGRLPGLTVTQTNGEPLSEGFSMLLRGQSPVILIDGIPRSVTEIGMNEIESVTVLKDAVSLAMLGIRGSSGAIAITTKKGSATKTQINFNLQTGIQEPLKNLIGSPLNAYNYATLYNEALTNDGLSVATNGFSQVALNAYQSGSDQYKYPDVNWRDQVMKNRAMTSRYDFNTSGGNNFVRYFVNLETYSQDGLLKTSDANKYNTTPNLKGYFIRSNVDVNLTDKLSAGIYIQGRILNSTAPGNDGTAAIFNSILATPANAYPIYNPDGSYAGNSQFTNNIVAQNVGSGYSLSNTRTVLSDFYLKRSLDDVTKGLWIKARASFFSNLNENIVRSKSFAVFEQTGASTYRQYGTTSAQSNSNGISFQNRSDFEELSMGYTHNFDANNGLDATLLANRDNLINGSNLPYTIQGISGHVAYNYKKKYLAEVSFAQSGANRYPDNGGFKYGFFPAMGLGWNINEERFMQPLTWLNHLKLYGSYGKLGHDNATYFLYQQVYNATPTAYFGSSAAAGTTVGESYLANPNITWEKSRNLNVGLEGAVLHNQLSFDVEYYNNLFSDLYIVRGTNTGMLGIDYPSENIGRQRYYGWEAQLNWAQKKKSFGYFFGVNASLQNSKLLYSGEPTLKYSWMYKTGHPVGQTYGYIADGLFRSQQEINGAPTIEGYTPQPGDIKYRDLNGDGVINQYDQTTIGSQKPTLFIGSRLGFNVFNFDFSTLLQGVVNQQVYLSGADYWEFQSSNGGQAYTTQLNRWTPATAATATYPRLTTSGGPRAGDVNNFVSSSFWLRNGDYLRVKTIELGYTLPGKTSRKVGVQSARIFVNALNMATLKSLTFNGADPENYSGMYPIERVFNLGVNIQL
ncbi:TonB-linked SusC/RagA family outer membrane protein [Mucilaginibacter yixingensis]|uniref:TonB-linked SusC/RagA family outer membrane protein n=1 Tax=Mucilaginibacter yixingensis TaxID=1295612 RepID=A0A2T5JAJ7_9SPHI|nr:SusC/RagA family TonB-linked outer membrane protein [Mucilaginibacter yixingensis]PTQ97887.1 TonB-linked SusC/RagA family outer membrane protein [Mucilaginibacter yixingensis]